MMWQRMLISLVTLILAGACGPGTPAATLPPTPPEITGRVEITMPQPATVVYAEALYLSGTAENIPDNRFTLHLLDSDDQLLAQTAVTVQEDGRWQVELVHGYSGDPDEASILALPSYPGAPAGGTYAARSIMLAGSSARPEGAFGSITGPLEGDSIGGDFIQVSGTVSGVFENEFTLELVSADGRVIDQRPVLTANPYYVDEVPWSAELATNGYTGPATVRAYDLSAHDGSEIALASVNITLTNTAG